MRFALFLIVFASLLTSITIEKPWNEYWWTRNNSNIYITPLTQKEVWNSPIFHSTLENISLEQIDISSQEVQQKIVSAKASLDNARFHNTKCQEILTGFRSFEFFQFVVTELLKDYGLGPLSSCIDYGVYWKETMSNSVDALILSIKKVDSELKLSTETFAKTQQAGICEEDYSSAGKEECILASSHLFNAQNLYSTLDTKANEINQKTRVQLPSLNTYQETLTSIWSSDGILSELNKANSFSLSALSKSEDEYYSLLQDFESLRKNVQEKLNELSKHNLQKIKETKTTTEFLDDTEFLQIYQRFEEAKDSFLHSVELYEKGSKHFKRKSDNYLKESLNSLQEGHSSILSANYEFDNLKSAAISIIGSKREDAMEAIGSMNESGSESSDSAEKARNFFEEGEKSRSLGDQFEFYTRAIIYASLAKTKRIDSNILILFNTKKQEVEDLLKRSKMDGVNVNYEETLFSFINSREKIEDLELLNNMENSIYESAELMYGTLVAQRNELLVQIQLGKDETADLASHIHKYDTYFFSDSLNYPKAIGNLKAIQSDFFDTDLELQKSKKKIVSSGLTSETSFFVDAVELDVPTDIQLEIFLKNNYGYSAEDVAVHLDLPTDIVFFRTDILNGSENIGSFLQSGRKLNLGLKSVPSFYRDLIILQKPVILAYTTKYSKEVIGHGDATATSLEVINFELDIDSSLNLVGKVDGLDYKKQNLKKGQHKLEREQTLFDVFSINYTNYITSNIGLNSVLYYDLVLSPNVDMDSATIYISRDPNEKIKSMKVSSITGEKVKEKKDLGNGIYSVVLENLVNGREAILRVQLEIDNSSSYISDQLSLLQNQELDADLLTQLNNAEHRYNNGDIDSSLKEIQKIKNELEKRKLDEISYKRELNKTIEDAVVKISLYEKIIQDAKNQNISDPSIDFILEKKLELETIITNGSLEQLKSFDYSWEKREISQIKKQSLDEYNKLKKLYLILHSEEDHLFSIFEDVYNRLAISNDLSDLISLLSALQELRIFVNQESKLFNDGQSQLERELTNLKEATKNIFYLYKKESEEAKGTQFESLFVVGVNEIEGLLKSKSLNIDTLHELNKSSEQMKEVLDILKSKAKRNTLDIQNLAGDKFSDDIFKMNQYYENGDFIKSLKQADLLLSKLSKDKPDDTSLLILSITAILIIIGIVYSLLSKKPKEPIKVKKLERIEEG